ncbi:MAG: ATP-binding protein, partial [Prevotella sp.]|nr:ATP-binding protein [Prevotella sp.]
MILRVTFENILSFYEETQISFVAGKSSTHAEQISRAKKRDDISILKSGIIYGANASGKSNIIKSIDVLRKIATGKFPKRNIEPFKLIPQSGKHSKIEIEFKANSSYYAYGVEFNIQGLREEWLYEINSRTEKKVFSRIITDEGNEFDFGTIDGNDDTQQFVKFLSQGTPTDRSFLSEYVKRNGQGLDAIKQSFNWFSETLKIIFPETRYKSLSFRAEKDKDFQRIFKSLLEVFNTGIVDIRRTLVKKEMVNLPTAMIDEILSNLKPEKTSVISLQSDNEMYFFELDEDGVPKIYKQQAIHKDINKEDTIFDMREESDGSIRLLD